jgi:hypothetical protein
VIAGTGYPKHKTRLDRVDPALFDHMGYKIGAETVAKMLEMVHIKDQ